MQLRILHPFKITSFFFRKEMLFYAWNIDQKRKWLNFYYDKKKNVLIIYLLYYDCELWIYIGNNLFFKLCGNIINFSFLTVILLVINITTVSLIEQATIFNVIQYMARSPVIFGWRFSCILLPIFVDEVDDAGDDLICFIKDVNRSSQTFVWWLSRSRFTSSIIDDVTETSISINVECLFDLADRSSNKSLYDGNNIDDDEVVDDNTRVAAAAAAACAARLNVYTSGAVVGGTRSHIYVFDFDINGRPRTKSKSHRLLAATWCLANSALTKLYIERKRKKWLYCILLINNTKFFEY